MINVSFNHSIEFELFRIAYTQQRIEFYKTNNYNFDLPEGLGESSTAAESLYLLANEYKEKVYLTEAEELLLEFKNHSEIVEKMIRDGLLSKEVHYKIFLTKYGVGGSFAPPNQVTLKITNKRTSVEKFATILHELIHVHIHNWIVQNNLTHWQKERVVDLIGLKYFPDLRKVQNIKEDVSIVDEAFEIHYPDLQKTIENIGVK
jgi:hypothetical protein